MNKEIDGKTYKINSEIEKDLLKLINTEKPPLLAQSFLDELYEMELEQLYCTEMTYLSTRKLDIKNFGQLSAIELAIKLTKFVLFYKPKEVHNEKSTAGV